MVLPPLLKGIVFFTSISVACFVSFVLLIPQLLLLLVHSKRVIRWRRSYADWVSGVFLDFATALHILVCGTKIYIYSTSKEVLTDKGALIICNHRCRVDWMYAGWCYTSLTRNSPQLRIILKESLRSVPILGWAMQILLYIFLDRKRDVDLQHIEKSLAYLLNTGARPSVFLFPEGTDLSPSNVIKNCDYAKEKNLPEWQYVLLPKPSGLRSCLLSLQGYDAPVHDVTIAYKDHRTGQRPTENTIMKGEFPREIHLCIKRMMPDSIPTDQPMLERWLRGSFARKEKMLRSFYSNGSCALTRDPNARSTESLSTSSTSPLSSRQPDDLWPPMLQTHIDTTRPLYVMGALTIIVLTLLVIFSWCRWIVTLAIVACVAFRAIGGIDRVEHALHLNMIVSEGRRERKKDD